MPPENMCSLVGISERQFGWCDGSSHLAHVFPLFYKQERRRLSSMSTFVEEKIIGRSLGVVFAVIVPSGPGSSGSAVRCCASQAVAAHRPTRRKDYRRMTLFANNGSLGRAFQYSCFPGPELPSRCSRATSLRRLRPFGFGESTYDADKATSKARE